MISISGIEMNAKKSHMICPLLDAEQGGLAAHTDLHKQ